MLNKTIRNFNFDINIFDIDIK